MSQPTPATPEPDSEYPTEPSLWHKKCGCYDPREPSVDLPSPRQYQTAGIPSPTYMPTSPNYTPTIHTPEPAIDTLLLDQEMQEQLRRAQAVAAALDREIARIKAQLEVLEK